jgi:hypothetical protein
MLFDKEGFVVIAYNRFLVCIYFAVGASGVFHRVLKQQRLHTLFDRSLYSRQKSLPLLPSRRPN